MKKSIKKIIAVILTLMMAISAMPITALADDTHLAKLTINTTGDVTYYDTIEDVANSAYPLINAAKNYSATLEFLQPVTIDSNIILKSDRYHDVTGEKITVAENVVLTTGYNYFYNEIATTNGVISSSTTNGINPEKYTHFYNTVSGIDIVDSSKAYFYASQTVNTISDGNFYNDLTVDTITSGKFGDARKLIEDFTINARKITGGTYFSNSDASVWPSVYFKTYVNVEEIGGTSSTNPSFGPNVYVTSNSSIPAGSYTEDLTLTDSKAIITGGTFKAGINNLSDGSIYGGTFTNKPEESKLADDRVVYITSSGYKVQEETPTVAQITRGEEVIKYLTLSDAISCSTDGETIVVTADNLILSGLLKAGSTLDLNGNTINLNSALSISKAGIIIKNGDINVNGGCFNINSDSASITLDGIDLNYSSSYLFSLSTRKTYTAVNIVNSTITGSTSNNTPMYSFPTYSNSNYNTAYAGNELNISNSTITDVNTWAEWKGTTTTALGMVKVNNVTGYSTDKFSWKQGSLSSNVVAKNDEINFDTVGDTVQIWCVDNSSAYVAKIGDTGYFTLEAAVAAAIANDNASSQVKDEIKLLKDISLKTGINITKAYSSFTIDLNEKTLSTTWNDPDTSTYVFSVSYEQDFYGKHYAHNTDITLKNGTIDGTNQTFGVVTFGSNKGVNVELEDLNVTGGAAALYYPSEGTLSIKSCQLQGVDTGASIKGGTAIIKDSYIAGWGTYPTDEQLSYYEEKFPNGFGSGFMRYASGLEVQDNYSNGTTHQNKIDVTIIDSEIYSDGGYAIDFRYIGTLNSRIVIYNSSVNGSKAAIYTDDDMNSMLNVYSGKYSSDPSDYLPDGYGVKNISEDPYFYTIVDKSALKAAITTASVILDQDCLDKIYTKATLDVLKAETSTGKTAFDSSEYNQTQIDTATQDILTAIDNLVYIDYTVTVNIIEDENSKVYRNKTVHYGDVYSVEMDMLGENESIYKWTMTVDGVDTLMNTRSRFLSQPIYDDTVLNCYIQIDTIVTEESKIRVTYLDKSNKVVAINYVSDESEISLAVGAPQVAFYEFDKWDRVETDVTKQGYILKASYTWNKANANKVWIIGLDGVVIKNQPIRYYNDENGTGNQSRYLAYYDEFIELSGASAYSYKNEAGEGISGINGGYIYAPQNPTTLYIIPKQSTTASTRITGWVDEKDLKELTFNAHYYLPDNCQLVEVGVVVANPSYEPVLGGEKTMILKSSIQGAGGEYSVTIDYGTANKIKAASYLTYKDSQGKVKTVYSETREVFYGA